MKTLMFLFRHFDTSLPKDFLIQLKEQVPNSIIFTVNNETDFNRWDISYRTNKIVIEIIEDYNKLHGNELDKYFKFLYAGLDGFIDCNSETREETWKVY